MGLVLLMALVIGVLSYFYNKRIRKLRSTKKQLKKLTKISTNQEIINLGQKNLIERLSLESKSKSITKSRWVDFLEEYNKINPDFNQKIIPYGLTKGETRLAILLLSQLTDHDIANLLSVNVQTVYIKRQRLKNKLKLQNSKELVNFLSTL